MCFNDVYYENVVVIKSIGSSFYKICLTDKSISTVLLEVAVTDDFECANSLRDLLLEV